METSKELIDFCIQVGDLGGEKTSYPDFPLPTYFIHGNHENWDKIEEIKEGKGPKNLFYLQNGVPYEIDGLNVLALGGNHAPSKFHMKRSQLLDNGRRHFVNEDVDACIVCIKKIDIFLTHEAPSPYHRYKVYQDGDQDIGKPIVSKLLKHLNPRIHFFGHHHNYRVYEAVPGVKSVGLSYGFSEILLFNPHTFCFSTKNL
jgi:Icc-related predicted phosphoesterase